MLLKQQHALAGARLRWEDQVDFQEAASQKYKAKHVIAEASAAAVSECCTYSVDTAEHTP